MENTDLIAKIKHYEYELREAKEDYAKTSYGGKITMIVFGAVMLLPSLITLISTFSAVLAENDADFTSTGVVMLLILTLPFIAGGSALLICGIVGLVKRRNLRISASQRMEEAKRNLALLYPIENK